MDWAYVIMRIRKLVERLESKLPKAQLDSSGAVVIIRFTPVLLTEGERLERGGDLWPCHVFSWPCPLQRAWVYNPSPWRRESTCSMKILLLCVAPVKSWVPFSCLWKRMDWLVFRLCLSELSYTVAENFRFLTEELGIQNGVLEFSF